MVSEAKFINTEARQFLKETSRTFYIPITYLSKGLQEAVASAYLCMRAIDEIEITPSFQQKIKAIYYSPFTKSCKNPLMRIL